MRKSTMRIAATAVGTVALVAALAACAPAGSGNPQEPATGAGTSEPVAAPVETPEADEFGVVLADSWKDIYPGQYATYKANEANSPEGKMNYLEEYPELTGKIVPELPDEKFRRVGQSMAAASLPEIV